ncbi:MAG TPA: pilus assembly protein TadG-related protein [Gemmatimonadales bacterium]|nr:pilus assembly protein TadG-related protein [Gemmatimonadales bacterium]
MYSGLRLNKVARKSERGVTLAIMALMLFLALGMSATVIDYGMVKASKAEAQRAMDAAALAGASAFKDILDPALNKRDSAETRARNYAKKHSVHNVTITDAEIDSVVVDVAAQKVTAWYTSGDIPLWFANVFGIGTMRVQAMAAADVYETSKASCVMPVAVPDLWKNNDVKPNKKNDPVEDPVSDGLWNFVDKNNNGVMDGQEREHWEFDPGIDEYDPAQYGYGSSYRNTLGGSNPFLHKTNDYGRQITIMTIDSKDGTTSSNYYAWGLSSSDANSAQVVAGKITDVSCDVVTVGAGYDAVAGDGGQVGQVSPAWDARIGYDPGARWDDATNSVVGSKAGTDWLTDSPRVVIVALYSPVDELLTPNDNKIVFNNFAKMFVDTRPPGCSGAQCKAPITARFLGFVGGPGGGSATTGTLIKNLRLIK